MKKIEKRATVVKSTKEAKNGIISERDQANEQGAGL